MLHIISTRRAFHTTMQKARKLLAVIQNHTRIQRKIVLLLLPEWSRLLCTHSLLGFSPSSLPAGSRTDQGRHDSSQHSSLFLSTGNARRHSACLSSVRVNHTTKQGLQSMHTLLITFQMGVWEVNIWMTVQTDTVLSVTLLRASPSLSHAGKCRFTITFCHDAAMPAPCRGWYLCNIGSL